MKIVVIGGVAAGTSAAAKAKRDNPEAEVVIYEKDVDISYSGCGLPYYISNLIEERDDVIIYTPDRFEKKKGVKVETKKLVEDILEQEKKVLIKDLESGKQEKVSYDKLLIATGARPVIPAIKGIELENVFALRNVVSADKIKSFLSNNNPKQAVIVGGGYIGLEMAESLLAYDLDITVIEMMEQVLNNFDSEMAKIVVKHLEDKGVEILTGEKVTEFQGEAVVELVKTDSGKEIKTDFVLASFGVEPNVELAKQAGIELGPTGAIKVNNSMETSQQDIYAAGDCIETTHLLTNKPTWIPLGSTANKTGRVAGSNLAGGELEFKGVLGTAITKICELTVARTGLTEKEAKAAGYEVLSSIVEVGNHAHYYPGFEKMKLKLVFKQADGLILGGQIIGKDGVNKRIDVLATAIFNQMSVDELMDLDLAYAPPYSSPKDGVMIAGVVADKKMNN